MALAAAGVATPGALAGAGLATNPVVGMTETVAVVGAVATVAMLSGLGLMMAEALAAAELATTWALVKIGLAAMNPVNG